MMPIGPLMIEHRLIERIIPLLRRESERLQEGVAPDVVFIEKAVDFFANYADHCHHGKEEDILFATLGGKPLTEEHRQTMNALVQEHVRARGLVGRLRLGREAALAGKKKAVAEIQAAIAELADFYPRHIETEDHRFFMPAMHYLTDAEQAQMLGTFAEFDRRLIHARYKTLLEEMEHGAR